MLEAFGTVLWGASQIEIARQSLSSAFPKTPVSSTPRPGDDRDDREGDASLQVVAVRGERARELRVQGVLGPAARGCNARDYQPAFFGINEEKIETNFA